MVQIGYSDVQPATEASVGTGSFVLRADERGDNTILSTGATAAYVGGHPDAFVKRRSSFNFHEYQQGRAGFGRMRVFGDEEFHNPGCSYSMHPHHNFIICAFVLEGQLIHVNTAARSTSLDLGTSTPSRPVQAASTPRSTSAPTR